MWSEWPLAMIAIYTAVCAVTCWRYVPRLLAIADRPLDLHASRFRFEFLDMYALVVHGALLYYLLIEPYREHAFSRMSPESVALTAGIAVLLAVGWLIGVRFLSLRTPKSSLCRLTFLILIPPPACAAVAAPTVLALAVINVWLGIVFEWGLSGITKAIPFTLIYAVVAIPVVYLLSMMLLSFASVAVSIPSSFLLFEYDSPPPQPDSNSKEQSSGAVDPNAASDKSDNAAPGSTHNSVQSDA